MIRSHSKEAPRSFEKEATRMFAITSCLQSFSQKIITNKSNDNKSGDESRGNSNAMITLNLNIDFV